MATNYPDNNYMLYNSAVSTGIYFKSVAELGRGGGGRFIYYPVTYETDRRHQMLGLRPSLAYPQPSSTCAALLCWKKKTPEMSGFGATCHIRNWPNRPLQTSCLRIVQKSFTKHSRGTFPSDHSIQASSSREIIPRANVPQPSLARIDNQHVGISLAEIELARPTSVILISSPALLAPKWRYKRWSAPPPRRPVLVAAFLEVFFSRIHFFLSRSFCFGFAAMLY